MQIRHGEEVDLWHLGCADDHFAAMADPPAKLPDLPPDPLDEHGAPRPAARPHSSNNSNDDGRGLSRRRIQELADWYAEESYRRSHKDQFDAAALDAELRAILGREGVFPEHVEVEFERVMQVVFAV
jgi:hypothetical protein